MEEGFKTHLQMNSIEREEILEQLDAAPKKACDQEARREKRWPYRAIDLPVIVRHPGGNEVRFLVCTRNISISGLSFIHGGFLYPGSECTVMLNAHNGVSVSMTGHIAHCRHTIGRYHEVGVRFIEKLDPEAILGADILTQIGNGDDDSDLPTLTGKILLIDYAECDRKLLETQLRAVGLEVETVVAPGLALDAIKRSEFDMIICDPALEPTDKMSLIKRIRDQGYDKPIILLTAETNPQHLSELGAESASERLAKPYCIENLFTTIARWLDQSVEQTPIYSTFEDRPDVSQLLADYIKQTSRLRQQLEKALSTEDITTVRKLCRSIQGSGSIYGFESVTVAAKDAVRQLDRFDSISESRHQVKLLTDICRSMRCSGAMDSSGEPNSSFKVA